jgi:hypothetical protein
MSHRKKLPIGIQTFAKIREDDAYYYVDKTPQILQLIDQGSHYFLSRPRRFGKSLLIDTIAELFEGNRALFTGLHAERHWDWSRTYPVIRISFGKGVLHSSPALEQRIRLLLQDNYVRLGLEMPEAQDISGLFALLVRSAHASTGQRVVVLVDEYDKPILDNITEPAIAREMRDGLRNLYSVIKDEDAHIKFAMLTGVSKFSKVSCSRGSTTSTTSRSMRATRPSAATPTRMSILCFRPELPGLDRDEIRRWYNGYNWTGTSVYNPFDLLLLFAKREFRPYWFETGTPTFLVDLLAERQTFTPELGQLVAMESLLSSFDVEQISTEALMFQSGYLTIASQFKMGARTEYTLKYPNLEVESSLNGALLQGLTGSLSQPGRQSGRFTACCRPTISPACRHCSPPSSPASRTTGIAATPSPSTRVTTPACSTATSPRLGLDIRWRT